jgi:hypothetical protein
MLRILTASLLLAALSRPADACNDHIFSRRIDGIAADGSFVFVESTFSGRVLEVVGVANASGKRIAWCESGEADDGAHDTWHCHGDARFRASGTTRTDRVAKAWTNKLGATTPLVEMTDAPEGIAQAICARTSSIYTGAGQIDCAQTNAKPLSNPSSSLVFLRFHVPPWKYCGATSTHDELVWVPRDQLLTRLAKRASLFTARKREALASAAREAHAWLLVN